jgi:Methyltransferase domain
MELDNSYDLRAAEQVKFANLIGPQWADFSKSWRRYSPKNEWYSLSDGAVYYSMLTTFKPKRIIEVGSGFSSAIALDVRDKQLHGAELTFIEPYPQRLLTLLEENDHARTTLYREALQDVPLEAFDIFEKDDMLFVDSTHVSKAGSDVNWLFFQVFPRLKIGVIVHIHDIFFPFEYIDSWLIQGRSWNELYMLRSFLSYNDSFEILFFNSWIWQKHPEIVSQYLPETNSDVPGSIWLRRTA